MYLLDTNVLSEIRKRTPHPSVASWFEDVDADALYISVLVLGEIRRGAAMLEPRDPKRAFELHAWSEVLRTEFGDRLLDVDADVAWEWGTITAARTVPTVDALLAATARQHDLILVTRNTKDFDGIDIDLLNPFDVA